MGTAALILAALSLLLPSTPSYDPWAWLGWGREIAQLALHTTGGPSWKPLPVLFTTLFAPLGAAAPDLWLVVARWGALMAVAMVFRLAFRLTRDLVPAAGSGPVRLGRLAPPLLAGLLAAASLINSGGFILENALGYSEGLALTLMLIALDRLMDGARRQAFVLGFLAGLDRPEVWFVWVPFGAWLAWRDPGARRLVLGLVALTPVLWFLPELWGSGQLFRGVVRAHHPSPGTPAFTRCPMCSVLGQEAWRAIAPRVKLPAIGALLVAAGLLWRNRSAWWGARAWARGEPRAWMRIRAQGWLLAIGGMGLMWWLGIALETQAGFAGNARYLVPGTALVAIAGGVAWGWAAVAAGSGLRRAAVAAASSLRRGTAGARGLASPSLAMAGGTLVAGVALVATPPWVGREVISLPRVAHELRYQAWLRSDLVQAIGRSGGVSSLLRCGPVMTEPYQVPMLAWLMNVPTAHVEPPPGRPLRSPAPGVILQDRADPDSALLPAPAQIQAWEHAGAHYALLARVRTFSVFSTCPHKVRG